VRVGVRVADETEYITKNPWFAAYLIQFITSTCRCETAFIPASSVRSTVTI
jgi:hypothetical protein